MSSRVAAGVRPDMEFLDGEELDLVDPLCGIDDWRPARSGVVRRHVPNADFASLRRFYRATWVFYVSIAGLVLSTVAGVVAAPPAASLILKSLPALLAFFLAGLAAAERAVCRCPVCGGRLLSGFWAHKPSCERCWFSGK